MQLRQAVQCLGELRAVWQVAQATPARSAARALGPVAIISLASASSSRAAAHPPLDQYSRVLDVAGVPCCHVLGFLYTSFITRDSIYVTKHWESKIGYDLNPTQTLLEDEVRSVAPNTATPELGTTSRELAQPLKPHPAQHSNVPTPSQAAGCSRSHVAASSTQAAVQSLIAALATIE